MSFMKSGVVDYDGQPIIASCPFYQENPLCVNSCAVFLPMKFKDEDTGIMRYDFNFGWCGMGKDKDHLLCACSQEEEMKMRKWHRRQG